MSHVDDIPSLVIRQALGTVGASVAATTSAGCDAGNDYDGRIGVRVSAIFVILIGSMFGGSYLFYHQYNRLIEH